MPANEFGPVGVNGRTVEITMEDVSSGDLSNEQTEPPSIGTPLGRVHNIAESIYQPRVKSLKYRGFGFIVSPEARAFRKRFFPGITQAEWNDWRWQIRNRIESVEALSKIVRLTDNEVQALTGTGNPFPFAITPYYASRLDPENSLQGLRRTVIPVSNEYQKNRGESEDPLGEERHTPVRGLVHRYPDRVLFLVTTFCSTYCRYCTRSRMVGRGGGKPFSIEQWKEAIEYIRRKPAVRDVLLSGGDPLTLSDEQLEWLLSRLREIPHVEFIRIGTKAPVVLPQRITPKLTRILRRYHPLWISIHFTHPEEITPETSQACSRLADAGVPLGSQTVLLRDINDDPEVMKRLVHGLLRNRVRPYYLYQCDPISGSAHFRTSVAKGIEIMKGLRGYTTGYAVPTYVIDTPAGGGKIPVVPEYILGRDDNGLIIRNYEGKLYHYPDWASDEERI